MEFNPKQYFIRTELWNSVYCLIITLEEYQTFRHVRFDIAQKVRRNLPPLLIEYVKYEI